MATNGKLFDRNKNPMLGTEFEVQFYNPETSSIKTASYSAYDHDYILRISRLFHSGGETSLAKPHANNDGNPGDGSGSDACCLFVWILIRMVMLLALTIFSGTMAVFSIVAFVRSDSPIFSVACLVPLVAFGLPLVALCVWSGWRFAKTCQTLGEDPRRVGENESYVKYGDGVEETV
ncbi:hypothetical protein BSKO_13850 [Bryopsis sp. KO-2023]|nr:hypothetical protein BSKO_13850 [Bryopsis sp. KO-2023]